jgi:2-polyprenyl-6-hydroxyphenyl methylase/3-demethylubiquinone-9 3-methyltransferase
MYIVDRTARFVRGFLLSYGPSNVKKRFWNKEYSEEKWAFAYNTIGDCVYSHLERYTTNGSILDIGCGSGNTSTEMAGTYRSYIGVDISEAALAKARQRSVESGRGHKNSFECADFLTYVPSRQYDVILFRESMYHVPLGKVKATLDRYSAYLKDSGVFVVRLYASSADRVDGKDKHRPAAMLGIIESEFDVVEKCRYLDPGRPTVMVFRPKPRLKN